MAINICLKNGDFHVLRDADELIELIREEMGEDVAYQIQKLTDEADYVKRSLETDILAYESDLDTFNSLTQDVLETVRQIYGYIRDAKKLNRDYILNELHRIQTVINNHI